MRAIQVLSDEHRLITEVLQAFELPMRLMELKGRISKPLVGGLLDFAEQYADHHHHRREEELLIDRLRQAGLAEKGGAAQLVLQEHRMGRFRIARVRELLPAAAAGNGAETARICELLRGYACLLRCHVGMEERIFFPMVENSLSRSARVELERDFERTEEEANGGASAGERLGRRLIRQADRWTRRERPGSANANRQEARLRAG